MSIIHEVFCPRAFAAIEHTMASDTHAPHVRSRLATVRMLLDEAARWGRASHEHDSLTKQLAEEWTRLKQLLA